MKSILQDDPDFHKYFEIGINLVHTNIIARVFFDHETYQYDPTESLILYN